MTEKTAEWFFTQGAMGVLALLALAALVWVVKSREKDRIECELEKKTMRDAHLAELRSMHLENKTESKENAKALIDVTKQTLAAVERLADLEERRHQ